MARGRHVQRSGLLARLWPRRRRVPAHAGVDRFAALEAEVARLRVLGAATAATAAAAEVRARRAEDQLGAARAELVGLRTDLAALREELVWAFAERRLPVDAPVTVVDLRAAEQRTA